MILLRDYQQTLVDNVRGAMKSHRRVLMTAATGAGKTVIFSYIAANAIARGKRVLIIVHLQEIVDQIGASLSQFDVRYGYIRPGHTMTDDLCQIAMIQTLGKRLDRAIPPDLVIIDEAHHAVSPTYRNVLARFSSAYQLGVTATPMRLDGRGLGEDFDVLVSGPQTGELIGLGHLADFDYYMPPQNLDLSKIKTRTGDYAIDDLADAVQKSTITGDAVTHYRRHLDGKSSIAFAVNLDHAETIRATFCDADIPAAVIDGRMSSGARRDLVAAFYSGSVKVLVSCMLINEGFDIQSVSGIIMLRPTKSHALFLQQIGRALRKKSDGSRAVILDHVGNYERFGSPKRLMQWTLSPDKSKKSKGPIVRQCPACYQVFDAIPDICPQVIQAPDCIVATQTSLSGLSAGLEYIDDDLVLAEETDWTGGIDIARAYGAEYQALIARAKSMNNLREIARIRGYKRGWASHVMKQRA